MWALLLYLSPWLLLPRLASNFYLALFILTPIPLTLPLWDQMIQGPHRIVGRVLVNGQRGKQQEGMLDEMLVDQL